MILELHGAEIAELHENLEGRGRLSGRRRPSRAPNEAALVAPSHTDGGAEHVAASIESAERQLGLLLRRMRAYRSSSYDFANSRITNDTEFERCLDLATALGIRIGELSGLLMTEPAERERIRHNIVLSLYQPSPFARVSAGWTMGGTVLEADLCGLRVSAPEALDSSSAHIQPGGALTIPKNIRHSDGRSRDMLPTR